MRTLRQVASDRLQVWAARRGPDTLPATINRRRVYILPSRYGLMLAVVLTAMLIAGLNYNSNLALSFAFLMGSLTIVTMHHCNRNLLRIKVDATPEADTFAGRDATFEFVLRNESRIERRDIEIRCDTASSVGVIAAGESQSISVQVPMARRGVTRIKRFELRTRFPFGWFFAWTYVNTPLVVYTAPAPAGGRALPSAGGKGSSAYSEARGDEDFSGLRAYEAGVPLKHMAWKVLARGGEAAVRSYSSLAAQPEWLEWSGLEGLDDEARLSQLCQWVLESEAASRPYGLRIPGQQIEPSGGAAHRFVCLRALAAYGTGTSSA